MDGERSGNASAPVQQRAVSFWDMLTVLGGASTLGGAVGAALSAHVSGPGLMLAAAWGVLLGLFSIACVRVGGGRLLDRASSPSALRIVYAGAALWVVGAAALAGAITRSLVALLTSG